MFVPTHSILFPTLFILDQTLFSLQIPMIVYYFTSTKTFIAFLMTTGNNFYCFGFDKPSKNPLSVFFENTLISDF